MIRDEALKGLSREHHEALVLARRASATAADPYSTAAHAQSSHVLQRWTQQFAPHFDQEERTLLPALTRAGHHDHSALALQQHGALRQLVARLHQGDQTALALWGDAMTVHVRFEERTLFPLAQTLFGPAELTEVMKLSTHLSHSSH